MVRTFAVDMKKSSSEQQSNRFKLAVMKPLESAPTEKPQQRKTSAGRTSLNAIPTVDPATINAPKPEVKPQTKDKGEVPTEVEAVGDELCNSYKFVVNYGVFEQNFEWLPIEVSAAYRKLH